MKTLFLIPARGGSKGVPKKNIKKFNNKELIFYSIDLARKFSDDKDICVSTDSIEIKNLVESYGLKIQFIRPYKLATDDASSYDVIMHSIKYFENIGVFYDRVVLLQPTSPLREYIHLKESLDLYSNDLDMIVSVEELFDPSYSCYNENSDGFLKKIIEHNYTRRQDIPKVYKFNGAIYVLNVKSLGEKNIGQLKKVKKYIMSSMSSIDIDNQLDWEMAEFLYSKKISEI